MFPFPASQAFGRTKTTDMLLTHKTQERESTDLRDSHGCRIAHDGAVLHLVARVLTHQVVPHPGVPLAGGPLPEHGDGGPDVAAVVAEGEVVADGVEHVVCGVDVPLVEHGQLLPDAPGGAPGGVPPRHPGAPDQLITGHGVSSFFPVIK